MNTLRASELILNADGSIYHLHLFPEDISDTIITVGDPDRVEKVSRHFDHIDTRRHKREFVTHTGTLKGKRITVISTGIGTDNIDIVFNELDALVNIDFETRQPKPQLQSLDIIRIGTSGSLQADIPVGSFLISEYGIGLDILLHFYPNLATEEEMAMSAALKKHIPELPLSPYIYRAGERLLEQFGTWTKGATVTCSGFYAPQGRNLRAGCAINELPDRLTHFHGGHFRCTNFEMETAAMYGMARLLGHHALSCNVILANRPLGLFSQDPGKDEEALIVAVLDKVVGSEF